MANEIKPTTFRVSEEVKEHFNKIIKEQGWKNQDEALSKLIHIQEIEQAKVVVGERKTEIETFEAHLNSLSEIYRISLQLNMDAEERIKTAYQNTLESNQKMIQDLQNKIATLETDLEMAATYQDKNDDLEKEIARIYIEMQKTNDLCMEYKDKNDTLNGLLTTYQSDHEENIALHKKIQELDKQQANMIMQQQQAEANHVLQLDKLQAEISNLKQQQESALKMCQLELKEKQQEKMDQLKNRHHEELEQATTDYKTVLQELDQLRKENYGLKEQLLKTPAPGKSNTKKVRGKAKEEADE